MPTFTQNPPDQLRLLPSGELVMADGAPSAPYLAAFVADAGIRADTPVCVVGRAWLAELTRVYGEQEALHDERFAAGA